jgi:hypothetical protein
VILNDLITERPQEDQLVASRHASSELIPDSCPPSPALSTETPRRDEDEQEVEEIVNEVARSCSISDTPYYQKPCSSTSGGGGKEMTPIDLIQSPPSPMDLDQESVPDTTNSGADSNDVIGLHNENKKLDTAVPPAVFYGSKGKKKQKTKPDSFPSLDIGSETEKKLDRDTNSNDLDRGYVEAMSNYW